MSLVEQLTRIHRGIPGCRSVVFGDIRTRTVLRTCADDDFRQEDHDRCLCEAASCLGPAAADLFGMVLGPDSAPLAGAILRDERRTSVFLFLDAERTDVVAATAENSTPPMALAEALLHLGQPDE